MDLKNLALTSLLAAVIIAAAGGSAVSDPLADANAAFAKKDYATANALWQRLADSGNAIAQLKLGRVYQVGVGVPQDYLKAVKWFELSARQDNAEAESWLADDYHEGQGVRQDFALEVFWSSKAAQHGYPDAQFTLGSSYLNGTGVPRDLIEAYKWLKLAEDSPNDVHLPKEWIKSARLASGMARGTRQYLVLPRMTPDEIARADKLVAQFTAR